MPRTDENPVYKVDLSRSTGLVSAGVHEFKVIKTSDGLGQAGPYIRLICAVQEAGPEQGMEGLLQLSLSDASRWKLNAFLDSIDAPRNGQVIHSFFMGKKFRAKIAHDETDSGARASFASFMKTAVAMPTGVTELFERPAPTPAEDEDEDEEYVVEDGGEEVPAPKLKSPSASEISAEEDDIPF